MGRHVAGNQLQYHVAAILATLAHQHPVIAILPMQGQAHGHAEVGQFQGEALAVGDADRFTPLQGLGEVQRHADALIAQAFGRGFDEQRQRLEVARVLADERARHIGSWLKAAGRRQ